MTEVIRFVKCSFCTNEATGDFMLDQPIPICENCVDNPPAILKELIAQFKENQ